MDYHHIQLADYTDLWWYRHNLLCKLPMPYRKSNAQTRAERKYQASLKQFSIRVKPDHYDMIVRAAKVSGMSARQFMLGAIDQRVAEVLGELPSAEELDN